jgi:hypothetical protein
MGSNPAEAIGFFSQKKPSFGMELSRLSHVVNLQHEKDPYTYRESCMLYSKLDQPFLAHTSLIH